MVHVFGGKECSITTMLRLERYQTGMRRQLAKIDIKLKSEITDVLDVRKASPRSKLGLQELRCPRLACLKRPV
jgi:hypothetical protein